MSPLVEFIDQANFVWQKGGALMPALSLPSTSIICPSIFGYVCVR